MKRYQSIARPFQAIPIAPLLLMLGFSSAQARVPSTAPSTLDFAAIDDYVEGRMRELRIPGLAMSIVEGDRIAHLKGFGIAGSDGRPVTPQTPFQINSLKELDSSLGDQRLLRLPYNVAELLLGRQPTVFPADPKPSLLYAILFLAVIVQVAGISVKIGHDEDAGGADARFESESRSATVTRAAPTAAPPPSA